jgi:hypothetical protein
MNSLALQSLASIQTAQPARVIFGERQSWRESMIIFIHEDKFILDSKLIQSLPWSLPPTTGSIIQKVLSVVMLIEESWRSETGASSIHSVDVVIATSC